MIKKRKNKPTESIENSSDSSVEHAFIKYPRENPIDVSGGSTSSQVYFDGKKINDASTDKTEEWKIKKGMEIHTHPFHVDESGKHGQAMVASGPDLRNIFSSPKKTHLIAYRDIDSGKVAGYVVIRKLKWKDDFDELEKKAKGVHEYLANLRTVGAPGVSSPFNFRIKGNYGKSIQKGYDAALNKASKDVGFRYKYIPTKGYEFDMEKGGLVKKTEQSRTLKSSKIEQTVLAAAYFSLILSILFFSSNLTGNVIGTSQSSSNIIGGTLFLIGIIAALIYFKNR